MKKRSKRHFIRASHLPCFLEHYKELNFDIVAVSDIWKLAIKVETAANTGGDALTSAHVSNWMECVRSRKQPNAPVEAGYYDSIVNIMTNAAVRTGCKAIFDENTQEVMVNGKVLKY